MSDENLLKLKTIIKTLPIAQFLPDLLQIFSIFLSPFNVNTDRIGAKFKNFNNIVKFIESKSLHLIL